MAKKENPAQKKTENPQKAPETGGLLSNKIVKYAFLLFWTSLVVLFSLFLVIKMNKEKIAPPAAEPVPAKPVKDSTKVSLDSLLKDSPIKQIFVDSAVVDSAGNLLTLTDQIKILSIENGRRQREIDYMWETILRQNKKIASLVEKLREQQALVSEVDSLKTMIAKLQKTKPDSMPPITIIVTQEGKKIDSTKINQNLLKNAKIYSSMKPKQAAEILSNFDIKLAAKILMKLRERQAAKILESMNPNHASRIGKLMATIKSQQT